MDLQAIVKYGLELGADFVEVRKEHVSGFKIHCHLDGTVDATHGSETGVGIRIAVDGSWSFVSSNQLDDLTIKTLIRSGVKTATSLSTPFYIPDRVSVDSTSYPEKISAKSLSVEEKIDVIKSLQETVKDVDERILGTDFILEEFLSQKQIYSSAGTNLRLFPQLTQSGLDSYEIGNQC